MEKLDCSYKTIPYHYHFRKCDSRENFDYWRTLLPQSQSHEVIYQTPEYFECLLETIGNTHDSFPFCLEIHQMSPAGEDQIIGLIPCQMLMLSVNVLPSNRYGLGSVNRHVLNLMGSIPLIQKELDVSYARLLKQIFLYIPTCQGISLPALPYKSKLRKELDLPNALPKAVFTSMMNGWRDCHTIPLPLTIEEFWQQFGRKKRYNLKRQIRQMQDHCGGTYRLVA